MSNRPVVFGFQKFVKLFSLFMFDELLKSFKELELKKNQEVVFVVEKNKTDMLKHESIRVFFIHYFPLLCFLYSRSSPLRPFWQSSPWRKTQIRTLQGLFIPHSRCF